MHIIKIALLVLSFAAQISHAHLLKVFAFQQPITDKDAVLVSGKVYFSGGSLLADTPINVLNTEETIVFTTRTDAKGQFVFEIANGDYVIVANSLDGHIAKWTLNSTHIKKPNTSETASSLPIVLANESQQPPASNDSDAQPIFSHLQEAQIEKSVAIAVAQQIQPLSEQINSLEEKSRFSDILGAIGYIFGIFGLFIWWKQRDKATN